MVSKNFFFHYVRVGSKLHPSGSSFVITWQVSRCQTAVSLPSSLASVCQLSDCGVARTLSSSFLFEVGNSLTLDFNESEMKQVPQ